MIGDWKPLLAEISAKVVLQGKNPFMDNNRGLLSPEFGEYLPYSQIYNVNSGRRSEKAFFIVRHYLNIESLSVEEINDIRIASSDTGEIFSTEKIERVDKTTTLTRTGKSVSSSKLLDQMHNMVRGSSPGIAAAGVIILTVHKANSIEKKGLVGKADPYVVMQLGDQKVKSGTVDNNHNPVWHSTGQFTVFDLDREIKITVFDEDLGKDDFLGEANVSIEEVRKSGEVTNKVVKLEKCKSGTLMISAKFVPVDIMKRCKGKLSLIVHGGKKLEKKNKLKKADPYCVIKLGQDKFKSATINNNNSPVWEFKVETDYMETSPRQASIEVFDDDIGKDAPIGNITVDINEVIKTQKIEQSYKLENCKTGDIMISAFFSPAVLTEEVVVSRTAQVQSSTAPADSFPGLKFSKPVYIGDEFAVVDRDAVSDWFLIVSPHPHQPINVSIVPYRRQSQPESPLLLYCFPAGSFHAIRRVIHSGQGLRKCGFESHCVLREGNKCQVYTKDDKESCGSVLPYTWGRDLHDALVVKSGQRDFLDLLIKDSETGKLLTTLTLSLYHDSVEAA